MALRRISVLACALVVTPIRADESKLIDDLLGRYEEHHKPFRRYYSNAALTMDIEYRIVPRLRLSTAKPVPTSPAEVSRRRVRCVIYGAFAQLQYIDDHSDWHYTIVARYGDYSCFQVTRTNGYQGFSLYPDDYENTMADIRSRSYVPWAAFCIAQAEFRWPTLEEFLRRPRVRVERVSEVDEGDKRLLRIDFAYQPGMAQSFPPSLGSVWLDPQRCWVIVRGQRTKFFTQLEGDDGKFLEVTDNWSVEYEDDVQAGIPKVIGFKAILHSLVGPNLTRLQIVTDEVTLRVVQFTEDASTKPFSPADFGFSRWTVWRARLGWFWEQYQVALWTYYAQLALFLLLVAYITYRRWRRWRLARTASSSGTAA